MTYNILLVSGVQIKADTSSNGPFGSIIFFKIVTRLMIYLFWTIWITVWGTIGEWGTIAEWVTKREFTVFHGRSF